MQPTNGEGFYSPLTREYYETEEERAHYENRATLMAQANEKDPLDDLTADQIAALTYRAFASEQQLEHDKLAYAAALRFAEETPGYVANAFNGQLIVRELERLGLDDTRPENMATAFESLRRDGLIQANAKAEQEFEQEIQHETRRRRIGSLSTKRNYEPPPPAPIDPESLSDEYLEIMTRRAVGEWFK